MGNYAFLNIPTACEVGNTIFKKLFYENVNLSSQDRKLFIEGIKKITWLYCLKTDTIHVQLYKDNIREYGEIEIIEVELTENKRTDRIAEIIMRAIPYPMVLVFVFQNKRKFYLAHQRNSLNDSSRNTIEEFITTEWIDENSMLLKKMNIQRMRFTNLYALYCDIMDTISIDKVSDMFPPEYRLSGQQAREFSTELDNLEQKITELKTAFRKETQFNRRMEMNIEIKKLEEEKIKLVGGFRE